VLTIDDMSFGVGQNLTIAGKVKSDCNSFSINIGHGPDSIALHFNPRFKYNKDRKVIVCNSYLGSWGVEQKERDFPFNQDGDFKVEFSFSNDRFLIKLPNGNMIDFPNRSGDDKFKHLHVKGAVKLHTIEFRASHSTGTLNHITDKMVLTVKDMMFKAGQELSISGKVKSGCEKFSINIGHDADNIALHFNPRFCYNGDTNIIVCNSNQGGWGEEVREHSFPFQHDEAFKVPTTAHPQNVGTVCVTINFNNEQFYIKLPNGTMMSFPNRHGDDAFNHFDVRGDVKVEGIKMK
ncbi:hypothetical protein P4O66_007133, partial [Electrophorus voltai]